MVTGVCVGICSSSFVSIYVYLQNFGQNSRNADFIHIKINTLHEISFQKENNQIQLDGGMLTFSHLGFFKNIHMWTVDTYIA